MLLTLWNYLKGYVIIEINGFSIERFLNLTINNGINIENLNKTTTGIMCKVSLKDFKKLKAFSRKTKCKIQIKQKIGLPFIIFKNKKRKAFCFGVIFFVAFLYFLSSFIWTIEIVGNDRIDNNSILKFCEENGFHIGSYKRSIKIKDLEKLIKNNFDELSWVTVQIKGTSATIKLSETIPKIEDLEEGVPSSIVANSNSIITEIVTRSGTPLVKEKDIVKAGDVLVSGVVYITEGEETKGVKFVEADADIKAKTWCTITVDVPFNYSVKEYTGKSKTRFEFMAFNNFFKLNFIKSNNFYENYDTITERTQLKLGENFALPFMIIKNKYKEYTLVEKTYSLEEAKAISEELITEQIISEFDISTDILEKTVYFEEFEDKITAVANLTIIHNIGVSKEITEEEQLERSLEFGTKENTDQQ